jgi:cytoskeletal protein RodZ
MSDTTPEPAATPEVTRSPWHISRIPGHLGRARTSTLVLAVLFVAIFALYLYVKPETPAPATGGTEVPVSTTAPAPTTAARTTTPEQTSEQQPTTSEAPTTTAPSEDTTTATLPSDSGVPTTTSPALPTPTVSPPTG